jgi:hypothetical protein
MRTIKFRAYIPQMKRACLGGKGLSLNDIRKLDESYFRDDVVWVEFTGLHDKNGKEIWEGDIVRWFDHQWEIKWGLGRWAICGTLLDYDFSPINHSEMEVIGNIYENPELLKIEDLIDQVENPY